MGTTCPRAEEDQTGEKWALPFAAAPLYTYYDEVKQAMAKKIKAESLKTAPAKEKFASHASFKLTRHPIGGTDKLKDFQFGQPQQFSASETWVDGGKVGKGKEKDPLKQTLSKELAQAKEGAADHATRRKIRKTLMIPKDEDDDDHSPDDDEHTPLSDKK